MEDPEWIDTTESPRRTATTLRTRFGLGRRSDSDSDDDDVRKPVEHRFEMDSEGSSMTKPGEEPQVVPQRLKRSSTKSKKSKGSKRKRTRQNSSSSSLRKRR